MNSISRSTFIQAIQTGITRAGGFLTEPERDALRQVAVSSNHTGDTFGSGCPWSQAFGDDPEDRIGAGVRKFSTGYDYVIQNAPERVGFEDAFNRVVA